MTKPQPALGRVVVSRQGRDKGRAMLIVGIVDEEYVLVADGDLRRIERPKKKKRKHLDCKSVVHEGTAQALAAGKTLLDADVRRALCDVFGCEDGQKE